MWPFKSKAARAPQAPIIKEELVVDPDALAALCPHIRAIVDAELRAGNTLEQCGFSDWPRVGSIVVTVSRWFVHTYPAHYPVAPPVHYQQFDHKKGDGDSYYCTQHSHLVMAPMPTLQSLRWNKEE